MSKYLLLAVALHHLTGSAELVSFLNQLGHCQSYSMVLELETAMANQVKMQDSILPANIYPENHEVCHLCWDNFDILEENPSGAGTTHTTHGIIVQQGHKTIFPLLSESLWGICRALHNSSHSVPPWSGWISKTSQES